MGKEYAYIIIEKCKKCLGENRKITDLTYFSDCRKCIERKRKAKRKTKRKSRRRRKRSSFGYRSSKRKRRRSYMRM